VNESIQHKDVLKTCSYYKQIDLVVGILRNVNFLRDV